MHVLLTIVVGLVSILQAIHCLKRFGIWNECKEFEDSSRGLCQFQLNYAPDPKPYLHQALCNSIGASATPAAVTVAPSSAVSDSGGKDKKIRAQDKDIIGFGVRFKGKYFVDAYDDVKFRTWYLTRFKNKTHNFSDAQIAFAKYCKARSEQLA